MRGLDQFKRHFAPFVDNYVLIGGTACMLVMEEAGLSFRATKDLDIVLCVEALDSKFIKAFWEFIKKGKYQCRQKSTGKKLFYRFHSPEDASYPQMLELFSRKPDSIPLVKDSHLTPIPIDEEISSLSAILLDEEYYLFIHQGKRDIGGLSVLNPEWLIPLKARAWLNLSAQFNRGASIDEKDIRKHKNDIVRLYQLLTTNTRMLLPETIKQDMQKILNEFSKNPPDLRALGLKHTTTGDFIVNLSDIYQISLDIVEPL